MSMKHTDTRPSTPPSSLPTSPATSRDVALRTPLKISRPRHPSFAPVTPQSLKASRSPLLPKNKYDQAPVTSPSYKLSASQASNWRVHEDVSSNKSGSQEYATPDDQSQMGPMTPTKPLGPFTPQVAKQMRGPVRFDADSDDFQTRGSLTDPPPRRRVGRPLLPSNNGSELAMIKPLDISVPTPQGETTIQKRPLLPTGQPRVPNACASCGSHERLSLLQPCLHHICASCVAGSLNVASEKSMICMHCHSPIDSFKIARTLGSIHSHSTPQPAYIPVSRPNHLSQNAFNPSNSYPHRLSHPHTPPKSTITLESSPIILTGPEPEAAVLRIDNVPWDVTPFMLENWLGYPVVHCHVLLDRLDGRTLNHAYVETTPETARAALRTHQNKILGEGRRSRPVTLTLSGQEELMHDLFPSWPGRFKGTTPLYEASLVGPQGSPPFEVLTGPELSVMLHLIQSPKVPCLAYWSLLSTLVKFPTPDVFAPGLAPDALFDITIYSLEKYETLVGSREYDCILHTKLIAGAIHCQAFTDRQLQLLLRFTNRPLPVIQQNFVPNPNFPIVTQGFHHQPQLPYSPNQIQHIWREGAAWLPMDSRSHPTMDPCDQVAQDFGIDPSLVYALAERLTLRNSATMAPLGRL